MKLTLVVCENKHIFHMSSCVQVLLWRSQLTLVCLPLENNAKPLSIVCIAYIRFGLKMLIRIMTYLDVNVLIVRSRL